MDPDPWLHSLQIMEEGHVPRLLRLCDEHADAADALAAELARARLLSHKLAYAGRTLSAGDHQTTATVAPAADGQMALHIATAEENENTPKGQTYASDAELAGVVRKHYRAALEQCVRAAGIRADIFSCISCLSCLSPDLIDLSSAASDGLTAAIDAPIEDAQGAPMAEISDGHQSTARVSASDTSDDEDGVRALFATEPAPARTLPSKAVEYTSPGGTESLVLDLVGEHSLWGHHVWNAARWFADWSCANRDALRGLAVVELGAGAGLPSIAAARWGAARRVLATDYPDADLVANLAHNVAAHAGDAVSASGFLWGDTHFLHAHSRAFDVAILCDVVFNHSEHERLLRSVDILLADRTDPCAQATHGAYPPIEPADLVRLLVRRVPLAFVVFTHYRPWLAEKDMAFLARAAAGPFAVRHVESKLLEDAMFPADAEDPRVVDPDVLRTVHAYVLVRREQDLELSGDEADP